MTAGLEDATAAFYTALNAVLGGDPGPMLDLWSPAEDVTYMSPFGELLSGREAIRASWQLQADQHLGGEVHPEELRFVEGTTLGIVVGFERGSVEVDGESTRVDIRATSTYRQEGGGWAMIGHHTDPLG